MKLGRSEISWWLSSSVMDLVSPSLPVIHLSTGVTSEHPSDGTERCRPSPSTRGRERYYLRVSSSEVLGEQRLVWHPIRTHRPYSSIFHSFWLFVKGKDQTGKVWSRSYGSSFLSRHRDPSLRVRKTSLSRIFVSLRVTEHEQYGWTFYREGYTYLYKNWLLQEVYFIHYGSMWMF